MLGLFKCKKRRELQELQLKSHYIKSLQGYMFLSYDIFHQTSQRYPDFNIGSLADIGSETVSSTLDLIHSAMTQFKEVAALTNNNVKVVSRDDLNKWVHLHPEEYEAAIWHIVGVVQALAKKKEAQAKVSR